MKNKKYQSKRKNRWNRINTRKKERWDFLEEYFNKELSDLSKGEVFIVTDKFENDDEYHRYKVTQYKIVLNIKKLLLKRICQTMYK